MSLLKEIGEGIVIVWFCVTIISTLIYASIEYRNPRGEDNQGPPEF